MKIIYDPKVIEHNTSEFLGEGSYRIQGIEKIGEKVDIAFDVAPFIIKVHSAYHLQKIKMHCNSGLPIAEVKPDSKSYDAALASVGLAISASKSHDFAVTRPPGHHAGKEQASGFCFFNNIAIAAQELVDEGKKVFIIDIDGHHGDGTESIFYSTDKVLYCSIHQEHSFPYGKGNVSNIGSEEGRGYTINIPIPSDSGDDIFLECLEFLEPYIEEFRPDIIGVSAGFDGFYKDRLLSLKYSREGYYKFGKKLQSFGYPVFAVLEGGYHNFVLECIENFVDGINDKDFRYAIY